MITAEISQTGQKGASSSWQWVARVMTAIRQRRQAEMTRRAVADLEPDQLADIGYPEPPRPTIEVKRGLMARLMSMS